MCPTYMTMAIDIAVIAAGTAEKRYFTPPWPGEWKLAEAWHVPATTDAAHATNYTTLSLIQGSTTLGTLSNETTAFTAGTAREFTLTGGASLEFTAGDILELDKAESGSGGTLDGSIMLGFVKLHL